MKYKQIFSFLTLFAFLVTATTSCSSSSRQANGPLSYSFSSDIKDMAYSSVAIHHLNATIDDNGMLSLEPSGVVCAGAVMQHTKGKPLLVLTAKHCIDSVADGVVLVRGPSETSGEYALEAQMIVAKIPLEGVDLALLTSLYAMEESGPQASVASSNPKVGEDLIVIGCPGGHKFNVTKGILSNVFYNEDSNLSYYRTDADSYFGNSGGPVFNSDGDLIGILVAVEIGRFGLVPGSGMVVPTPYVRAFLYGP